MNDHEAEEHHAVEFSLAGKKEKAHSRGIVGIFTYDAGHDGLKLISVGHDSLKIWKMDIEPAGNVSFSLLHEMVKWRCGVQSTDATIDGRCVAVVGLDSILYEVIVSESGPTVVAYDLGYMESWHVRIARNKVNYMTTSFSGFLSEINMSGEFSRREPINHVKQVSVLAYSNDNRILAVGNYEGVVRTYDVSSFKNLNSYEIHAMKIRAIVFSPDDDKFLTASDDKTLKLFSLTSGTTINTYCGCSSPISCVSLEMNRYEGKLFVTGSVNGDILLWTLSELVPLCTLSNQHEGGVWSVTFSNDGHYLFSTGEDKRILCFNIPNLEFASESSKTAQASRLQMGEDTDLPETMPPYKEIRVKQDVITEYEEEEGLRKPAIRDEPLRKPAIREEVLLKPAIREEAENQEMELDLNYVPMKMEQPDPESEPEPVPQQEPMDTSMEANETD